MIKVSIESMVVIIVFMGVIASMVTGTYTLTIVLIPPLVALLIYWLMCKIGLIPKIRLKKGEW